MYRNIIAAALAVVSFNDIANAETLRLTITPIMTPEDEIQIDAQSHHCLTEALYFEARNQTVHGKIAVGNVILNRAASPNFPDSVCGVVHQGPMDGSSIRLHRCQFSYYCDGLSDDPPRENILEVQAWDFAEYIALMLLAGHFDDNTHGSTYYHATYVSPFWADMFTEVAVVDDHIFYTR